MLMKELISSCSHDCVAEAGVVSIGPAFLSHVTNAARRENMSAGAFAARAVRRFRAEADAADWKELREICARDDMPILRGLRHIVEKAADERHHAGGWRSLDTGAAHAAA